MSVQPIDDPFGGRAGPWTEDDWLALPEGRHVELLDGSLLVSPFGGIPHQRVVRNVADALKRAAPPGFEVFEGLNGVVVDADRVALAVEVTSPSNAWVDRRITPELYAGAGIRHLRIDLHCGVDRISATACAPGAEGPDEVARSSDRLVLDVPFPVELDLPLLARATR